LAFGDDDFARLQAFLNHEILIHVLPGDDRPLLDR